MHDNRLDYIRSLALLMVIMVHSWSLGGMTLDHHSLAYGCYHVVCDSGVPLFVMLSGALLLGRRPLSAGDFFRKRYTRLLVPFVVWALVAYVLSFVMGIYPMRSWGEAVWRFVPYLAENKVNYAYWYVPMMAMLYLITPLLNRALATTGRRAIEGYLAVGVALVALRDCWADLYVANFTSEFLPYLLYYLFGYYAYTYLQHASKGMRWGLALVCVTGAVGYALALVPGIVCRVLMVMGLFALMLQLSGRECRAVQAVGECSYAVYLVHFMPIRPLYGLMGFDGAGVSGWTGMAVATGVAVVVLLVCTAACLVARKVLGARSAWLGIA